MFSSKPTLSADQISVINKAINNFRVFRTRSSDFFTNYVINGRDEDRQKIIGLFLRAKFQNINYNSLHRDIEYNFAAGIPLPEIQPQHLEQDPKNRERYAKTLRVFQSLETKEETSRPDSLVSFLEEENQLFDLYRNIFRVHDKADCLPDSFVPPKNICLKDINDFQRALPGLITSNSLGSFVALVLIGKYLYLHYPEHINLAAECIITVIMATYIGFEKAPPSLLCQILGYDELIKMANDPFASAETLHQIHWIFEKYINCPVELSVVLCNKHTRPKNITLRKFYDSIFLPKLDMLNKNYGKEFQGNFGSYSISWLDCTPYNLRKSSERIKKLAMNTLHKMIKNNKQKEEIDSKQENLEKIIIKNQFETLLKKGEEIIKQSTSESEVKEFDSYFVSAQAFFDYASDNLDRTALDYLEKILSLWLNFTTTMTIINLMGIVKSQQLQNYCGMGDRLEFFIKRNPSLENYFLAAMILYPFKENRTPHAYVRYYHEKINIAEVYSTLQYNMINSYLNNGIEYPTVLSRFTPEEASLINTIRLEAQSEKYNQIMHFVASSCFDALPPALIFLCINYLDNMNGELFRKDVESEVVRQSQIKAGLFQPASPERVENTLNLIASSVSPNK